MTIDNSRTAWGSVAKSLHWLVFALLIIQLAIGAVISSLDMYRSEDVDIYLQWIPTHKSIGLTIFLLVALRLIWRWLQPRPEWPTTMSNGRRIIARGNHILMYVFLLLQPLLGLAQSSAYGATTRFYGLFEVPSIVPEIWSRPNTDVVRLAAQDAHKVVAVLLILSIGLHVAAALKHHFVDQDELLLRMLPKFKG